MISKVRVYTVCVRGICILWVYYVPMYLIYTHTNMAAYSCITQ